MPMVFIMSIGIFFIVELPPGNYVENLIVELELQGAQLDDTQIQALYERWALDKPVYVRWWRWFTNFLTGNMGLSMAYNRPISDLIMERLPWTVLLSVLTLIVENLIAIPIGIYSAVRKYSFGDYFWTFVGFIGLSIPNFVLALVLIFLGFRYFNVNLTGLFSIQFLFEPWSLSRVWDLVSRLWVPVVVIGTAGTAGLIRTLRGQMLDELNKPYVQTARAKGLKESVVIMKHALRVAINPMMSTIGWILPGLFSAEAITSIVLGIPTMGPLLLDAVLMQDMYLAGTIILIEGILVLIGTLISDIALALSDPRIRYD